MSAWVRHHRLSAADSLRRVLERPAASLLTWLVVGIALALPVTLALSLDNLRALGGRVDTQAQLSVFLNPAVDTAEGKALAAELGARPAIAGATFRSREDALAEFRARAGFSDVLGGLEDNPLPHLLLLVPREPARSAALAEELSALVAVDEVVLDLAWLERLQRLTALGRRLVLVAALLLAAGVLLVLGNTIRLAVEGRREEIEVTRLVGASDAFVRRPFLYSGLWYGIGGGAVAAILVAGMFAALRRPVAQLAAAYGADWRLAGLGLVDAFGLVLAGGALGLIAAWLAVGRHLRLDPGG
ncbi:Cell division protein FtsX [Pseudohaliea rubra DSM 19751]|uniref:Cell division protein FtsX n=2 Tax=Pseudohaliea TaxID=1341120 RepID=A0A095VSZ6_9GAMM|nr:Cell division protein FtsX [Pseudohaliea rubra DSM 19751]